MNKKKIRTKRQAKWTVTSAIRPNDKPTVVYIPGSARDAKLDTWTVPKSSTKKVELERVMRRLKDGMPMTLIADSKLLELLVKAYDYGYTFCKYKRVLSDNVVRTHMLKLIKHGT